MHKIGGLKTIFGRNWEGLNEVILQLRYEVLMLASQIDRAAFSRRKKQHVQGP